MPVSHLLTASRGLLSDLHHSSLTVSPRGLPAPLAHVGGNHLPSGGRGSRLESTAWSFALTFKLRMRYPEWHWLPVSLESFEKRVCGKVHGRHSYVDVWPARAKAEREVLESVLDLPGVHLILILS
jgi:hypothetical protein